MRIVPFLGGVKNGRDPCRSLTHDERVGPLDETLDLTERVILCSLISKLMELFYGQITEPRFCEKPNW